MTDLRKAAEMALDAMLSEYSTGGENKYSPWDVIEALRQALAQPKYHRGDRLLCLESEEYCVIHISGTDRQWVKFPDSHIGAYTNEQVQELFELLPKETDEALAQPEQEKESTVCAVDSRLLLGRSNNFTKETENRLCDIERRLAAIETQPALAQPEQERLSLRLDVGGGIARASAACGDQIQSVAQELPKREWVGLTVDEILDCYEEHLDRTMFLHRVKSIEAKIKEKNT